MLNEILTEKNKEHYLEYYKINRKRFNNKRLLFMFAFAMLAIAIGAIVDYRFYFAAPVLGFIGYKMPYADVCNYKKAHDFKKQMLFPTFLRHFISLLDTQGNVFKTLQKTTEYLKEPLKSEVEKLVESLEKTKGDNRDCYMQFAEYINSSDAVMIMTLIYEFDKQGIRKEDLRELENTLDRLQENKANEMVEIKVKKLNNYGLYLIIYAIVFLLAFTLLTQYGIIQKVL